MSELAQKKCLPCEGGVRSLEEVEIQRHLAQLPGWQKTNQEIFKVFTFKNYYETIAFVNAVALMAHQEDHHPHLKVSYKTCEVYYSTHAIGGLSENDFICAAKVEDLVHSSGARKSLEVVSLEIRQLLEKSGLSQKEILHLLEKARQEMDPH